MRSWFIISLLFVVVGAQSLEAQRVTDESRRAQNDGIQHIEAQNLQDIPAQRGAALKLDHSEFDFGTIKENGGVVEHDFVFVNAGNAPLVITRVVTSCSCTKAEFAKRPVAAGEKGVIKITFDPDKQLGVFYKAIQVYSNGVESRIIIVAKGKVVVK